MKKQISLILALFLLLLTGCQSGVVTESPENEQPSEDIIAFTDDLGRSVETARPQRVATLIGSFADIWCLAGGKESLVATAHDTWTSFDLDLSEEVADLGSISDPSLETLLAAEPDLIVASCNTTADVELLETFEQMGLSVAYFEVAGFEDYLRMLNICTQLTGCRENYETYGTAVKTQVEAAVARQDGSAPTVLYVRASGSSCKVKGSTGNVLGEMLAALGCVNIADSESSLLEELSLEAIIAADPDYIFAVLQGADADKAQAMLDAALLSNPAWDSLTAVQNGRFYTMDHNLYNLKPNARWGEAYEKLADILYPEQVQ